MWSRRGGREAYGVGGEVGRRDGAHRHSITSGEWGALVGRRGVAGEPQHAISGGCLSAGDGADVQKW
jgi:hypothetical protein